MDPEIQDLLNQCHGEAVHAVALQVAFERQTLKPVFHLIVVRLWV
jgi:hypothetical protein